MQETNTQVWMALFALGGLLRTLQESSNKEDFQDNYNDLYRMTLTSYRILGVYDGQDPTILNGIKTLLEALPKYNMMFPQLYKELGISGP